MAHRHHFDLEGFGSQPAEAPAPLPAASGGVRQSPQSRGRILLVDDEAIVRRQIARLLARLGYEVWEADGATVALMLLGNFRMDLVITDIFMPRMNGYALIEALRQGAHTGPVIAITGGGTAPPEETLARAGRIGADVMLRKPFSVESFQAAVDGLLGSPRDGRPVGAGGAS